MEIFKSGNSSFLHIDGYIYYKHSNGRNTTHYWRCQKIDSCRARATTTGDGESLILKTSGLSKDHTTNAPNLEVHVFWVAGSKSGIGFLKSDRFKTMRKPIYRVRKNDFKVAPKWLEIHIYFKWEKLKNLILQTHVFYVFFVFFDGAFFFKGIIDMLQIQMNPSF
uniref:FLYWCH-type domain-containing protein n=1 Tax=Trichogramma kaykai TaxID=54128 RepID=A0ABD2W215_9HYME